MARNYLIVKVRSVNTVRASQLTCQWNSWDGEHLTVVHSGYVRADALYEGGNCSMSEVVTKVPLLRFRMKTPIFVVQDDQRTQYTYARQLGIWSQTKIRVESKQEISEVTTEYQFALYGIRKLLYWPLMWLIPRWNDAVWQEDLPVKVRREKVLSLGFVDFVGFRGVKAKVRNLTLPMRKPPDSPLVGHPLYFRSGNRFVISEDGVEFFIRDAN